MDGHSPPRDQGDLFDRIRLIRNPTVGPIAYLHLLERYQTAAAAIRALPGLAHRARRNPPLVPDLGEIERERAAITALGGRWLALGDPAYPVPLAAIADPPPILAALGDLSLLSKPALAIVGARNASAFGQRFAGSIARDIGSAGPAIVSGLARGIDSATHEGTLASGTIAVLAGGIDIVYPPENERLQQAIAERGLLLAEMPLGLQPRALNFPRRN